MEQQCNFFNENGELKDLETVLNEVADIYQEVTTQQKGFMSKSDTLNDFLNAEAFDEQLAYSNMDFLNRIIFLEGDIEESSSKNIIQAINFWNLIDMRDNTPRENRIPISIFINTNGGDLNATFSIIDAIETSVTPIYTITSGKGYSAGFFIGIAGHKRFGFKHSSYLFHEGSSCNMGDAHKYLQEANFYSSRLKQLKQVVLEHSNITKEFYNKHKKDDLWMNAEQALELGVIDYIIEQNYFDLMMNNDISETIEKEEEENEG